jgi:low temperature requirement protein LtrA
MTNQTATGLLRDRTGGHARVGFVELFFDLVFVFAVTQLSHTLMAHPTLDGLLRTTLLMMAVWWAWMYTTWATNWLDVEHRLVRGVLFALMAAGVVMSAAVPEAFGKHGLAFGAAYALIQVGRSVFVTWAVRHDEALFRNFIRITVWLAIAGCLWIAGGLADPAQRLAVWTIALGIEYAGPAARFWVPLMGASRTEDWTIEGGHMAERCGLFIIIALGESILVTGATFAGLDWTVPVMSAFASAFVAAVGMWWIYFAANAEAASAEISKSDDPGAIARKAYTYVHILLVAGIIVSAVADEWVLAHPVGHTDLKTAMAVLGGPALFLLGSLMFKLSIWKRWAMSRLVGLMLLGGLAVVALKVEPLTLSWLATGVLLLVAVWETVLYGSRPEEG